MNPDNTATMQKGEDINEKIKHLEDHFQEQMGCKVFHEPQIDFHSYRFYFEEEEGHSWQYILDVDQGDLEKPDGEIADLIPAEWQNVLKAHSGKRVPRVRDRKFVDAATFREWPKPVAH